jgi:hypothetical protein
MITSHAGRTAETRLRAVALAAAAMVMSIAIPVGVDAQTLLPEITVNPSPPKINDRTGRKSGDDGKSEDSRSFDRLNEQLKRKVDETNPTGNSPPLDARSPDLKTGVVNIPGVQQQYGKNFGHSVIPYRPDRPVFSSPLTPRR